MSVSAPRLMHRRRLIQPVHPGRTTATRDREVFVFLDWSVMVAIGVLAAFVAPLINQPSHPLTEHRARRPVVADEGRTA